MYAAGVIPFCVALIHSYVYSGQSGVQYIRCGATGDEALEWRAGRAVVSWSGLYTRNGIGLLSPLLFFSLSLDFLDKLCRFSGGV